MHAARRAVLVVGRGSSGTHRAFEGLVHKFGLRWRARDADAEVAHAYTHADQPSLRWALEDLASRADVVLVAPLLLLGTHTPSVDVRAHPRLHRVRVVVARPLGVHAKLVDSAWAGANPLFEVPERKTSIVVVGRGWRDPDANGDFYKIARLIGERWPQANMAPCFLGSTYPRLEPTLEWVARSRPRQILVIPYFLFEGTLWRRLRRRLSDFATRYPWIKATLAPPLGRHAALVDVLEERVHGAARVLDRPWYPDERMGGTKSILEERDHGATRVLDRPWYPEEGMGGTSGVLAERVRGAGSALGPPFYPQRHVLVCGNVACASRGSLGLIREMRRKLRRGGTHRAFRLTQTPCLGRCGDGPMVVVYPDGIWYPRVNQAFAASLAGDYLLAGRPVPRPVEDHA